MKNTKIEGLKNISELEKVLNEKYNTGFCYSVSIVFGTVYITEYKNPSSINYNDYAGNYNHQYWKNGIWNDFPIKSIIKYQNTDGGE